jgi:Tol biopolymer transport system component
VERFRDVGDVRVEIKQILADPGGVFVQPITAAEPRRKLRTMLPWVAAAIVLTAIIAGIAVWKLKLPEPRQVMRFCHELAKDQQFTTLAVPSLAVSRDGRQFVYSTPEGLYLRSIDEWDAKLIPGAEKASENPFFSPDGKWIAYYSMEDGKLKKIAISGGAPVALCDAQILLGASWNTDNTIVYGQLGGSMMRVSGNGGKPEPLVQAEGKLFAAPQLLPDGKSVLFTNLSAEPNTIMVQLPESKEPKELFAGFAAIYLRTGHIVYKLGNTLFAVPFDADMLQVTGGPVSIVEDGTQHFISDSWTLVYIPITADGTAPDQRALVWVDRKGQEESINATPKDYADPAISPDGKRLALTVNTGGNEDIWIWDLARETMTRLTFSEGEDTGPLWTPDGKWIVYFSERGREFDVNKKAADGAGDVEKLASWPNQSKPSTWSRDGKTLLLRDLTLSPLHTNIAVMPLEGDHARKPLLQGKYNYDHPQISPDGRWLAYASNESGRNEIYVCPYPEANKGKWQISTSGGIGPLWSTEGRELFYRDGESVMAVSVETGPAFKCGKPEVLFRGTDFVSRPGLIEMPMWDLSPDGKRFLMIKPPASTAAARTAAAPRPKINIFSFEIL